MRVKYVRQLSGVCHSETFFTAGQQSQRSGSKKALKVDYGVKLTAAESANKRQKRTKCTRVKPGFAEELAVERDYLGQVRVIFQKLCKLGPDEPANPGFGKISAQGRKGRQSQDYIAQRAGLYYQDVSETLRHNQLIVSKRKVSSNQLKKI
jgi:hypothetical protein